MIETVERAKGYESFIVRNIHCSSCASTLQHTVASLPGVLKAGVDPMIGWTHIDYDPGVVTGDELIGAVEAAGYEIVRTWD